MQEPNEINSSEKTVYCYLMYDGLYYKIGKSVDPEKRLKSINTANPSARLIKYSDLVSEKFLHSVFDYKRVFHPTGKKSEWFFLNDTEIEIICILMETGECEIGKGIVCSSIDMVQSFCHGRYYWSNECRKNSKWGIPFGKYKGRCLTSMQSKEELQYINWFIKATIERPKADRDKFSNRTVNRFRWWKKYLKELKKQCPEALILQE